MKIKIGLVATTALCAVSTAQAADIPAVAEPINYVQACDAFGAGYFQLPGKETCIKLGGRIRANYVSHNLTDAPGVLVDAQAAVWTTNGVNSVSKEDADTFLTGLQTAYTNAATASAGAIAASDAADAASTAADAASTAADAALAAADAALAADPTNTTLIAEQAAAATAATDAATAATDAATAAADAATAEAAAGAAAATAATDLATGTTTTYQKKAAVEEKRNDYSAYTRGHLYFTSMTATEIGTIKTYTEFWGRWNSDSTSAIGTGSAYVQIGGDYGTFLFGRTTSKFDGFTGYTWIRPAGLNQSDSSALQVSYAADLGSAVTAAISVEDSTYRGGEKGALDIIGQVKLTQGFGSLQLSGAAHNQAGVDDYGFALGATATLDLATLKEGTELSFQVQYAEEAGKYIGAEAANATGYAISGGLTTSLSEKLDFMTDFSYLVLDQDNDFTRAAVNGGIVYSPVSGLGIATTAGWSQETAKGADDVDSLKIGGRVQYTF